MCVHLPNLAQPATVRQQLWIKRVPVHLANFFLLLIREKRNWNGTRPVVGTWLPLGLFVHRSHGTARQEATPIPGNAVKLIPTYIFLLNDCSIKAISSHQIRSHSCIHMPVFTNS
jgi:hypothetical protein